MGKEQFREPGGAELDDDFRAFDARLHGDVIVPGDGAYDLARRVYNAMQDHRPAMIVRVRDVADVVETVRHAASHDLLLAVRGGGHSVAGFSTCDGGMVLDLEMLRRVEIDPARRTARVGGGCTWGELDRACHEHGLATPGGVVSSTGVGGLTLGGGLGHLARSRGFSCDNLLSAEVVTSDGTIHRCSEEREPELFWALRGGGGNFGVVTEFEFRLHPIASVLGGPIFFRPDPSMVRAYRELIARAPEPLGAILAFTLAPPLPFVPAEWHGKPIVGVVACFSGPIEEGEAAIAPLRALGEVIAEHVVPMPYPMINTLFDDLLPPGLRHYWKSTFFRELSDEAIAIHLDHGGRAPCIESGAFIYPINGAPHRVAPDATAFAHRDANFAVVLDGTWHDAADDAHNVAWVRAYYDALRPYVDAGGYVNFMLEDDRDRVGVNYRGNYARLQELKRRYDPHNLFRRNHNIAP